MSSRPASRVTVAIAASVEACEATSPSIVATDQPCSASAAVGRGERGAVAIEQHDVMAERRQPLGDAAPDPLRCAGDERDAAALVDPGLGHLGPAP